MGMCFIVFLLLSPVMSTISQDHFLEMLRGGNAMVAGPAAHKKKSATEESSPATTKVQVMRLHCSDNRYPCARINTFKFSCFLRLKCGTWDPG